MTADPDFLEHFGVKGMKWGVRKTSDSDTPSRSSSSKSSKLKKAAVIAGGVALVAGAAYIAYKMNQTGVKIPVADLKTHTSTSAGKSVAERLVKSPVMNSPIPKAPIPRRQFQGQLTSLHRILRWINSSRTSWLIAERSKSNLGQREILIPILLVTSMTCLRIVNVRR